MILLINAPDMRIIGRKLYLIAGMIMSLRYHISRKFVNKDVPPVRRPISVKNWFGLDSTTDDSEPEYGEWNSVDRRKKSKERKLRADRKKEEKKKEVAHEGLPHGEPRSNINELSRLFYENKGTILRMPKHCCHKRIPLL